MFGRFFKRKKAPLPSKPEFLAGYMITQFLPDQRWQIPQADLDNYVKEVDPALRPLIGYWILIYCAWLFRLSALRQFGEAFEKDMIAAIRARLLKPDAARIKDKAASLEFWFKKLDTATSEAIQTPSLRGVRSHRLILRRSCSSFSTRVVRGTCVKARRTRLSIV